MQSAPQNLKPARSPLQGFLPFFWMALACTAGILIEDTLKLTGWLWAAGFALTLCSSGPRLYAAKAVLVHPSSPPVGRG